MDCLSVDISKKQEREGEGRTLWINAHRKMKRKGLQLTIRKHCDEMCMKVSDENFQSIILRTDNDKIIYLSKSTILYEILYSEKILLSRYHCDLYVHII